MSQCEHRYIVLFKGDDSDFSQNQTIDIFLQTDIDTTGCKAHFQFMDFKQDFDEIPADKKLHLVFPSDKTKDFPLGAADAKLWLEKNGKIRTASNRIHIVVTNSVKEAYDPDDQQAITVVITGGTYHPLSQTDIFDMECNDWEFRKVVAKLWETLGGKVLNND